MLSKISGEEVIKGYISDYTKIRDAFKQMLYDEGFRWSREWARENAFGKEGVWLNPVTLLSIRIRWGVRFPSAVVYAEKEMEEIIPIFFDRYEFAVMISPNEDYEALNRGDYYLRAENSIG